MELEQLRERLATEAGPDGDADAWMVSYDYLLDHNEPLLAAAAINRAYGLRPDDAAIRAARQATLDDLSVRESGITFRYIPEGAFLMGADDGDDDEQPVHTAYTQGFWLAETTMVWTEFCTLMGWLPAPDSLPLQYEDAPEDDREGYFYLNEMNKIRRQYCSTQVGDERRYDRKPMVAVGWSEAKELAERLSDGATTVTYDLPTEVEWEKAARGGLIGCRYPWGDAPPGDASCQFERTEPRMDELKQYPANGFGLYEMAGGVWEWTNDCYDALAYSQNADADVAVGEDREHVLRGGSWLDCAEAVRVSFRMSRSSNSWREKSWGGHRSPNIGFRLCRRMDKK